MKSYLFSLYAIAFILFGSCKTNDDEGVVMEFDLKSPTFLIGTWRMVGSYQSDGGPQYYKDISNGEALMFSGDGTFTSSEYSQCANGTYSVDGSELTLNYNCEAFDKRFPDLNGKFVYSISKESDFLLLSPMSVRCIEGCSAKFKKISN